MKWSCTPHQIWTPQRLSTVLALESDQHLWSWLEISDWSCPEDHVIMCQALELQKNLSRYVTKVQKPSLSAISTPVVHNATAGLSFWPSPLLTSWDQFSARNSGADKKYQFLLFCKICLTFFLLSSQVNKLIAGLVQNGSGMSRHRNFGYRKKESQLVHNLCKAETPCRRSPVDSKDSSSSSSMFWALQTFFFLTRSTPKKIKC